MISSSQLKKQAKYVADKIHTSELSIKNYVTTDNLLQNKLGVVPAATLPAQDGNVTAYKSGDILVANIRPYLKKLWYATQDGGCSADVLAIRPSSKVNSKFLYYALFRDDFFTHVMNGSKGTKMPRGDKSQIMDFLIPNFEIDEQQKIASVLSALDNKIELNNRINAELEAMAKTLYDYWFVQFDFPDTNGKPYKTSGGKMVYNSSLKREIPEGWNDCLLGDHITFKRGISYKSGDIQDEGIPLINLNSFSLSGEFKLEGTKYYNGTFKPESKLHVGDLVIAITDVTRNADIIGKAFVIPDIFDEEPLISCDVACVFSEIFGAAYLERLFNSENYHRYIKYYASGTLVLHLDLNGIKCFKTFQPPKKLLEKYNQYSSLLFKQRNIALKENIYLEALRDWLLPMLMNGQVTVK